jgi:hypothetical protein
MPGIELTPDAARAFNDLEERVRRDGAAIAKLGEDLAAERRTRAERDEEIAKREADAAAAMRAAKSAAVAQVSADAPESSLRRYVGADGRVRLVDEERTVRTRNGVITLRNPGFLTDKAENSPSQRRFRKAMAEYGMALQIAPSGSRASAILLGNAYSELRAAAHQVGGPVGQALVRMTDPENWARTEEIACSRDARTRAIFDGSTGAGSELIGVPTFNSMLIEEIRLPSLDGIIPIDVVQRDTWKDPIETGRPIPRKRGATADPAVRYPAQRLTTSDTTRSVSDFVVMLSYDMLAIDDVAANDPGFLARQVEKMNRSVADMYEMSILHGDTAGTHQDTIATWTLDGQYASGDLAGTDSALVTFLGARARAFDDSKTASASGTLSASNFATTLDLLGKHAAGAVVVTGLHCLYTQLFATIDKLVWRDTAGPNATMFAGANGIQSMFGVPIRISEFISNDFANTGLYTGSGSTTQMVFLSPRGWKIKRFVPSEAEFDEIVHREGARYIGRVERAAIYPSVVSGEYPAAVLYNL